VLLAGSSITLDAAESNELLLWLYEKRDTFFQLEHQELLQAKQAADLADEQIIQAVRQKALQYFARDPKNEQKIEEIWIDSRAEDKVAVKVKWSSGDAEEPVDNMIYTVSLVDGELGIHGPVW